MLASDIATLNSKITQIKADYYLSTETALFSQYIVSQGTIIQGSFKTNIDNMVAGFTVLKCRNTATNSNGTNSNGTNSDGTNADGTDSNLKDSNGTKSNGTQSNLKNSNGDC